MDILTEPEILFCYWILNDTIFLALCFKIRLERFKEMFGGVISDPFRTDRASTLHQQRLRNVDAK